jgi:hypothetical protein
MAERGYGGYARDETPTVPGFRPGKASVGQSGGQEPEQPAVMVDPTAVAAPWSEPPRPPLRYQARQLRKGGEWSAVGGLFAFVCWGIWAIAERGGSLAGPVLALVLVTLVAVGVFFLFRLLGRVVLERTFGRVRRSAWPSHLVTGVFLAAAGVQYLRQVGWIVDAWTWLRGLGW